MLTMLGIPNCDTIKKARKLLEANQVEYTFRDIRKEPMEASDWQNLVAQDTEKLLVNTRSPSFRKTGRKAAELDEATTVAVLLEQPAAMKRPTMTRDNTLVAIGFKADTFLEAVA